MKKSKKSSDVNVVAFQVVQEATQEPKPKDPLQAIAKEKNPAAVALGRLGGLRGGKARAKSLSPKKRKEIARKAAITRWLKNKENKQ